MKTFMDRDFLLTTETARTLYHDYAAECPIIDYHNHLNPREIYERRCYENLTQLWLEADHYKWRAMRVCGVEEYYVTGKATEYEKFEKFAAVMPRLIGSPVYHWAHLELQRYFGITTPLTAATAREIWDKTAAMLRSEGFDAVSLLSKAKVEVLCTTDDPADSLEWHRKLKEDTAVPFATLPSFRPDRFLHIDQGAWPAAVAQLGERYGAITDWDSLCKALSQSLDFFCEVGCRVTDHGFIRFRYGVGDPAPVMAKALGGEALTEEEVAVYQGALLRFLAGEYHRRDLIMQLHLGPIRNNSPKLLASFGPDAGGDSVGSATDPFLLSAFLNDVDKADSLPKTILYNLNPADSAVFSTMAVNFAADGAKVQYGAAWWLLDHIRGISEQIDQLMETGLLSGSVGMLTDSRAFTSFVRHEYFRRILCNKLGALVEEGQYPCDIAALGELVVDICHRNAERYFGF
ncbi:MAG: glucuronate isomerase [Oscillospiraceae bacterium]|nr:glucuronate isomerase [Oscillospiraceae bacterium]